jgi:hypothetical protein
MVSLSLRAAAALACLWSISPSWAESFQTSTSTLTNGPGPGVTLTTVPAGKQLVIEFVSAACSPTAGGGVVPNPLRLTTKVDHWIALTPGNVVGQAVTTHPTRIYADPGTQVNLTVFPTTGSATVSCNVAISGTLTPIK